MLSGKGSSAKGYVLGRNRNTACKACCSYRYKAIYDLMMQIGHMVDSFRLVQETLDISSVQDNILELKYTDK